MAILMLQLLTANANSLESAAFKALVNQNRAAFVTALEAGLDVNATDEVGTSLLMEVTDKFPDLVPELLKRGADVSYRSPSGGQPPLLEAMTQRNIENVKALLEAGATLQGEERRYAQNILSSFPDIEIAELLGLPTTNEDGSPIDRHAVFAWARDTRYASQACSGFAKTLRDSAGDSLMSVGFFDSGQFNPSISRETVLENLNEEFSYFTSASFVESTEGGDWLISTWASDSEYTLLTVGQQDPVFCFVSAIP